MTTSKPDLRIYLGHSVSEDDVYEWCRRAPYFLSWTGEARHPLDQARVMRRPVDASELAAEPRDMPIWPAFVMRVRTVALVNGGGEIIFQPAKIG